MSAPVADRPGDSQADPVIDSYLETLDHEDVVVHRGRRSGLYTFVAVHSTVRGPSLGGCRMWGYDGRAPGAPGRAAALAGDDLQVRGGRPAARRRQGRDHDRRPASVLSSERRTAALLDFADTVESLGGRYITAEDVGTSSRDMRVIAQRTEHVAGLPRGQGGSGDPSPFTALGVESAIRACCERVFSSSSLSERTVAVVGLGHVGLARRQALRQGRRQARGQRHRRAQAPVRRRARRGLGDARAEALELDVDVVAPCALGGVLDHATVPRLRCQIVAGAANNQLASESVAELLAAREILWAPDFVANAGGLINIAEEQNGYNPTTAGRRVRLIGDTLRQIFDEAEATDAHAADGRAGDRAQAAGDRLAAPLRARRVGPLDARGQAALVGELVEMGRERDGGGRAQARRHVGPGVVEQLLGAPLAGVERCDQPPLAVEAVGDVLVELRRGVEHGRSVAGEEDVELTRRAAGRARPGTRRARPDRGR